MAEAIVSAVLQQLAEITMKQIQEEVNLVRGVKREVQYLATELETIRNVLDDAERRGSYKDKTVQRWLGKLEDAAYDVSDVLDEWKLAILNHHQTGNGPPDVQVSTPFIPSCLCLKKVANRRDIAKKIKGLKKRMDTIVKEKERYNFVWAPPVEPGPGVSSDRVKSTSFVDVTAARGREIEKNDLVSKLVSERAGGEGLGRGIVAIKGPGGIGKTTVAQLVYNDDRVVNCFEKRIWICVSNVSDEVRIAKGIVEQANGSSPNLNELEPLLKCVVDCISGKRLLLVLDDVWDEYHNKWEPLRIALDCGALGSKILMTTRSTWIANLMGSKEIYELGLLSNEDCWLLMSRIAFSGRTEEDSVRFQDIGRNIANKCKGLPLAAKVLGGSLCCKYTKEEWESVLNSEIWQLEEAEVDLFPHLLLSYNELSPAMKRCFSYCAIFPKDYRIDVDNLIRMWMALGYLGSGKNTDDLERRGKEYFNSLKMRSLFQDHEGHFKRDEFCKMHDIVHDFALFLRKNKSQDLGYPNHRVQEASETSSRACDPLLVSQAKVYRSLVYQGEVALLKFDGRTGLRVLSLCDCLLEEVPEDIENLIHLRYLDLSRNSCLVKVPQVICRLHYLETLNLGHCDLEDIPEEIGNLVNLRYLNLSFNSIDELPETICNLHELRTLDLTSLSRLVEFPEGIDRLVNLRHLINFDTDDLVRFPEGLKELTGLQTLSMLRAGGNAGRSNFEYLNKLDQLSGDLQLYINVEGVEDAVQAKKAEMRNKTGIRKLYLEFSYSMARRDDDEEEQSSSSSSIMSDAVLEALQPPPNLQHLSIHSFEGTKFPGWLTSSSSLNHLTVLEIEYCNYCLTLPPLGKLPCLEKLKIIIMSSLKYLGREFLGITETTLMPSSSASADHDRHALIGFPRLKELTFYDCYDWREWEDITAEEEESTNVSIMPRLEELNIEYCYSIQLLPHRLLRKASSLQRLQIRGCRELVQVYADQEGSAKRSLSHIPHVDIF